MVKVERIVIASLIAIIIALCIAFNTLHSSLKLENERLKVVIEECKGSSERLRKELKVYEENYEKLLKAYNALKENYTKLINSYEKLRKNYEKTVKKLKSLKEKLPLINTTVLDAYIRLNSTLTKFLNELSSRWRIGPYTKRFIKPNDPIVDMLVEDVVGHKFNVTTLYDDLYKMYEYVSEEIVSVRDPPYPRISYVKYYKPENATSKLIAGFTWTIDYDMTQYPSETYRRRAGDCEDKSILLLSMIENYLDGNLKAYMICVYSVEAHCGVIVVVGDGKVYILDPTMHYISDRNVESFSVEFEKWIEHINMKEVYKVKLVNDIEFMELNVKELLEMFGG